MEVSVLYVTIAGFLVGLNWILGGRVRSDQVEWTTGGSLSYLQLKVFPFQHFKNIMPFPSVLQSFSEKSTDSLMGVPLYVTLFLLVPLEFDLNFAF